MSRHSNSCSVSSGCSSWESTQGGQMEFSNNLDKCFFSNPPVPFVGTKTINYFVSCYRSGTIELWQSGNNAFWDKTIISTFTCDDSNPHYAGSFTGIPGKQYVFQKWGLSLCGTAPGPVLDFSYRDAECLSWSSGCSSSCYIDDLDVEITGTGTLVYSGTLSIPSNDIISVSGNTVTPLKKGSVNVTVRTPSCCSASATATITVVGVSQTITYTGPTEFVVGETQTLSATATSGLTDFTYSCDQTGATISGNKITFSLSGVFVIKITQAGNDTYDSITVETSVTVVKKTQTVTASITSTPVIETTYAIGASATSGLNTFTYSLSPSSGYTISGNNITFSVSGTYKITVTQAGNDIYSSATYTKTLTVVKKSQTITAAIASSLVVGTTYAIGAKASSGLTTFTYSVTPNSGFTLSGNNIKFSVSGSYSIKITQAGNSTYSSATLTKSVKVVKKSQTVTYTGPKEFIVGVEQTLSATATSGLNNFTYSCDQKDVTILGDRILFIKTGSYTLKVTQPGNITYASVTVNVVLTCGFDNFNPNLLQA